MADGLRVEVVIYQNSANTRMERKRQNNLKVLMMSGAALHCRLADTRHHHTGPISVREQVDTWGMSAAVVVKLDIVVEVRDDTA